MPLAPLLALLLFISPAHAGNEALGLPAALHRPTPRPAPSQEMTLELFAQLRDKVQRGLDPEWVRAHVRSALLTVPPSDSWVSAMDQALTAEGALGSQLLDGTGPITTVQGPDYTRMVLDTTPTLSIVVRQDVEALVIDRFELTSCVLCDERTRFVRDLLSDVQRQGRQAHRLLPGVELDITPHLQSHPGLAGSKWAGTLQTRNHEGGELVRLLLGAEAVDADDDAITVRLADGTEDRWPIRYVHSAWRLDYEGLPDDSPLRMSTSQMKAWRSRSRLIAAALARWAPDFHSTSDGAGMRIASRAIGAAVDPRDGTVLVVLQDLDRVLAGVVRVDPISRQVVERWRVPAPDPRTNIQLGSWFDRWPVAISDDGGHVAISAPGRVWVLDLATGRTRMATRVKDAVALAWANDVRGTAPSLVVARRNGEVTVYRPEGMQRVRVPGEPLAVDVVQGVITVVTAEGATYRHDTFGRLVDERHGLCCEGVADAHLSQSQLVLACSATCDTAAVLVERSTGELVRAEGVGHPELGTSMHPSEQFFTTGGPSPKRSVLLWSAEGPRPIGWFGRGPAKAVTWSQDGQSALSIGKDGEVWLWDLAIVRQKRRFGQ